MFVITVPLPVLVLWRVVLGSDMWRDAERLNISGGIHGLLEMTAGGGMKWACNLERRADRELANGPGITSLGED